ncbi:MAG TPA: glycerophosphodiester phosphodiesterase, partial [Hymenobacter sp.]
VLDVINKKVPVNIELKGDGTAQPVAALIREYIDEHGWKAEQFRVLSFNHIELKRFIARMPNILAGASYEQIPEDNFRSARKMGAALTVLDAEFVGPKVVEDAHANGLGVYVYTVNSRSEARRLRKLRVDGIFSDYPDKVIPRQTTATAA